MGDEIIEPRLTEKLKALLEVPALKLYAPPPDQEDPTAPPTGINAWQFPEWFIVQDVEPAEATATCVAHARASQGPGPRQVPR